ncbi:MAG: hypothetical protein KGI29_00895 [Pseudomonadota bacterium]|nr:hypothetical protein [Pseudomonadota bacterium]MDE3038823.1 hypothetical protein [Pseudomonadota bacterium]
MQSSAETMLHDHNHGFQDTDYPALRNLYALWYARFLPQGVLGKIGANGQVIERTVEGERAGAPLQAQATNEFVKIMPALLIAREMYETRDTAALRNPETKQALATAIGFFVACGHDHHNTILATLDALYRQAPPLAAGRS